MVVVIFINNIMTEKGSASEKSKAVKGRFLQSAQIGQIHYAKGEEAIINEKVAKNMVKKKIFSLNS